MLAITEGIMHSVLGISWSMKCTFTENCDASANEWPRIRNQMGWENVMQSSCSDIYNVTVCPKCTQRLAMQMPFPLFTSFLRSRSIPFIKSFRLR